jgi:adenylate kinase
MSSIIVLMGPQGAGKGTQAKMVSERFSLPIVATGDILREIARTDTKLGRHVREVQDAGHLVSDEILAEIVRQRISQDDCRNGWIFDGFPRTLPQAKLLEELALECGLSITLISIDVPRDLIVKRLAGRRNCVAQGHIYNIHFQPSRQEGVCDIDGSALLVRDDDNPDAIAKRLADYDKMTSPLLDYFGQSGRAHKVDGTGTPQEVFERIISVIEEGKGGLSARN